MAELAIYRSTNFKTVTCFSCGTEFALLAEFYDVAVRLKEKKTWYCPNGHSQHFIGETEAERLKRELEAQKRRTDMALADAQAETKRRQKAERALTKIKKRVGNGVCPVPECGRHFTNVERHVATKHPEFKQEQSLK